MSTLLTELTDQDLPDVDIKAVFFDIDGTLLGLDGGYTEMTKQEIHRIKEQGIKTAVASGRPSFAASYLIDELGLDDVGQFCTGAHIYDPRECKDLFLSAISPAICTRLVSCVRELDLYCEIYTSDNYYIEHNSYCDITHVHSEHLRRGPSEQCFNELVANNQIIKFLSAVSNTGEYWKLIELEKMFPDMHFAYAGIAAYPDWKFVSIVDQSACKEKAFDFLLKYYHLESAQVMCLGDAHSDMTFVKNAGVGVAMGNASDELKAVANYVTKPVWQDGVSYAISRFIK